VISVGDAVVYVGDCRDVLRSLPDNSVDSVVTDPPYELGFMGKKWDSSGIAYDVTVWEECLRVLKPGGHVLAFGGSRTFHRLGVAIEDAGFEIRDTIAWISSKTFPKSLNVEKAMDKAGMDGSVAKGWGTGLKQVVEPVVLARKPLDGTVSENTLRWGVGGLNIDGSRIGSESRENQPASTLGNAHTLNGGKAQDGRTSTVVEGRWPANVILDEVTAGLLDEQSGISRDGVAVRRNGNSGAGMFPIKIANESADVGFGGQGGASRFFMVADTLEHDRMSLCKHTNANNVATLLKTIRATIESSARTNVEDSQKELNAQLVKSAGIQCDSCATHIAADLVALKTLASNAESSPLFHRSISDLGSSILTQSLVSLVEQWVSTDTIPTMTDFSTLFGCVLLATDELTKPVSQESDKGLSRFIYQAKASKRDRNEGLEELEATSAGDMVEREEGSAGMNSPRAGAGRTSGAKNFHPTVKPTQLMRYLIKLVTPEGGTVLDPFTGSGSTGKAALLDGFKFIGAELTEEYLPIIEGRLKWASEQEGETDERLF